MYPQVFHKGQGKIKKGQGYSVGALDFVMKPINYYTFSMKLKRVLKRVEKKDKEQ